MSADELNTICDDSKKFCQQVTALKETEDGCKKLDKIQGDFWKSSEGKENYVEEVRADTAKFHVHAGWLKEPEKSELSVSDNKTALTDISKRFISNAQTYLKVFENDKVSNSLISNSENIDNALEAAYRSPPRPQGPR